MNDESDEQLITLSLTDFRNQLNDIQQKFQKLPLEEKPEAVVLVQKLQETLLTHEGPTEAENLDHQMDDSQQDVDPKNIPMISDKNCNVGSVISELETSIKNKRFENKYICNTPVICKKCSKEFSSWPQFLKHCLRRECHDCPLCTDQFLSIKDLSSHLSTFHRIEISFRSLRCSVCSKSFHNQSSLIKHVCKHSKSFLAQSSKESNISYRDKEYKSLTGIEGCAQNERISIIYCQLCQLNFSSQDLLAKHNMAIHNISSKLHYMCKVCNKRFVKSSLFRSHKFSHMTKGDIPIKCSTCSRKFSTVESLQKHLATSYHLKQKKKLLDKVGKTFPCSTCGAMFKYKQGLTRHIEQKHSDSPSYKCSYCDFSCRCQTNLKRHMELHKDDRRFICELCGSAFNALATLKGHHSYVHSDERKFVCQICARGFKGRSGLNRHLRIHRDERPFVCFCTQSYKRLSHLKRHMLSAHKQKPKSNRVHKHSSKKTKHMVSEIEAATKNLTIANSSSDDQVSGAQISLSFKRPSEDRSSLNPSLLLKESRTFQLTDLCNSESILLPTVEIPLTTLEELTVNSVPFQVVGSDATILMCESGDGGIHENNTDCEEDNLTKQNVINSETLEHSTGDSEVRTVEIADKNLEDGSGAKFSMLINSEICSNACEPVISGTLWPEGSLSRSSTLQNEQALLRLHSGLHYNSLSADTFEPIGCVSQTSNFGSDSSDMPSRDLQSLTESLYPETIHLNSFLSG